MTTRYSTMAILVTLLLLGGCIKFADIRAEDPVREAAFKGSFEDVAKCVESRLFGKVQRDPFKDEINIYDSARINENRGLSHYTVTITQIDEAGGILEFRKLPVGPMDSAVVAKFWRPAEACAKRGS